MMQCSVFMFFIFAFFIQTLVLGVRLDDTGEFEKADAKADATDAGSVKPQALSPKNAEGKLAKGVDDSTGKAKGVDSSPAKAQVTEGPANLSLPALVSVDPSLQAAQAALENEKAAKEKSLAKLTAAREELGNLTSALASDPSLTENGRDNEEKEEQANSSAKLAAESEELALMTGDTTAAAHAQEEALKAASEAAVAKAIADENTAFAESDVKVSAHAKAEADAASASEKQSAADAKAKAEAVSSKVKVSSQTLRHAEDSSVAAVKAKQSADDDVVSAHVAKEKADKSVQIASDAKQYAKTNADTVHQRQLKANGDLLATELEQGQASAAVPAWAVTRAAAASADEAMDKAKAELTAKSDDLIKAQLNARLAAAVAIAAVKKASDANVAVQKFDAHTLAARRAAQAASGEAARTAGEVVADQTAVREKAGVELTAARAAKQKADAEAAQAHSAAQKCVENAKLTNAAKVEVKKQAASMGQEAIVASKRLEDASAKRAAAAGAKDVQIQAHAAAEQAEAQKAVDRLTAELATQEQIVQISNKDVAAATVELGRHTKAVADAETKRRDSKVVADRSEDVAIEADAALKKGKELDATGKKLAVETGRAEEADVASACVAKSKADENVATARARRVKADRDVLDLNARKSLYERMIKDATRRHEADVDPDHRAAQQATINQFQGKIASTMSELQKTDSEAKAAAIYLRRAQSEAADADALCQNSKAGSISTSLTKFSKVGDTEVEVVSTIGFNVGSTVLIGDEDATVKSLGPIVLETPLTQDHAERTVVKVVQASQLLKSTPDAVDAAQMNALRLAHEQAKASAKRKADAVVAFRAESKVEADLNFATARDAELAKKQQEDHAKADKHNRTVAAAAFATRMAEQEEAAVAKGKQDAANTREKTAAAHVKAAIAAGDKEAMDIAIVAQNRDSKAAAEAAASEGDHMKIADHVAGVWVSPEQVAATTNAARDAKNVAEKMGKSPAEVAKISKDVMDAAAEIEVAKENGDVVQSGTLLEKTAASSTQHKKHTERIANLLAMIKKEESEDKAEE